MKFIFAVMVLLIRAWEREGRRKRERDRGREGERKKRGREREREKKERGRERESSFIRHTRTENG